MGSCSRYMHMFSEWFALCHTCLRGKMFGWIFVGARVSILYRRVYTAGFTFHLDTEVHSIDGWTNSWGSHASSSSFPIVLLYYRWRLENVHWCTSSHYIGSFEIYSRLTSHRLGFEEHSKSTSAGHLQGGKKGHGKYGCVGLTRAMLGNEFICCSIAESFLKGRKIVSRTQTLWISCGH